VKFGWRVAFSTRAAFSELPRYGRVVDLTRERLVELLAEISHASYVKQKARGDPPANPTGTKVTDHDVERAEDVVLELERLGVWPPH
jgi:hypothetical protein